MAQIPGLEEQPQMAAGTDHVAFAYADREPLEQLTARPPLPAGMSPFEMSRL